MEATLPNTLFGDQIRLKQVLVNLTKNALKFSFGKPIEIKVCYDRPMQLLRFLVTDKGLGMREEDMNKLFILFGKIDNKDANDM